MGANIGTTVTSWLLSLSGLDGSNLFIRLLKPESFSPVLAAIGAALILFGKRGRQKDIGSALMGFAVLMFGMSMMSGAVKPLSDVPEFTQIFTLFSNPLLGVLVGALLTAIIQSSSASVGILQALAATGAITFGAAIPIILGQNIGTCATALISCVGASKNAKRAAMVHLYFNIIGTLIFLIIFYGLDAILHFSFVAETLNAGGIALVHTVFNLLSTVVLLPFSNLLCKLATLTIRDTDKEKDMPFLDERFLATPSFALEQCRKTAMEMAELARTSLSNAIHIVTCYDAKIAAQIEAAEDRLDHYEDCIGTYLVKLSSRELSEEDSQGVSQLLHTIGDLERIGDHALNIRETAEEIHTKQIVFSDDANVELSILSQALLDILSLSVEAFMKGNIEIAARVEPLEQVIDDMVEQMRARHIARLKRGNCTIELGFVFSDLLVNYERVSDHCSNIAICLIEIQRAAFDMHDYLLKAVTQTQYLTELQNDQTKYALPAPEELES